MDINLNNTDFPAEVAPAKVVITVSGGCVESVVADAPLDVVVIDRDVCDNTNLIKIDGEDATFHRIHTEVDDDVCQAVFKEIEDYENQPD